MGTDGADKGAGGQCEVGCDGGRGKGMIAASGGVRWRQGLPDF